jgi:2-C-methyl-D-erythritol 2,4-cyclodiphosphate synthase
MAGVERVGIGYDIHRLVEGRRLVLGGVQIAWSKGLLGHSDGDVVLHAVIDALLGAAGLPDIGEVFPDSDPAYKDADSAELAGRAVRMLAERGWAAVNADITVRAEQPRLGTYKQAMRERMAALLGLDADAVSVKAKTDEGLGPVGSGQAIACVAVVGLRSLES